MLERGKPIVLDVANRVGAVVSSGLDKMDRTHTAEDDDGLMLHEVVMRTRIAREALTGINMYKESVVALLDKAFSTGIEETPNISGKLPQELSEEVQQRSQS